MYSNIFSLDTKPQRFGGRYYNHLHLTQEKTGLGLGLGLGHRALGGVWGLVSFKLRQ